MQTQPQQPFIDQAISDDDALMQYVSNAYPGDCKIEDFVFYKNYLAHFKPPPFEILIQEQEEIDKMLIVKLIAASFETGYVFKLSGEPDSVHMKIFLNDEDKTISVFLDELEWIELENIVISYVEEQIKMEEAASKCPYSSLILALQRSHKLKKWNITAAMIKSKLIANQLINRENT